MEKKISMTEVFMDLDKDAFECVVLDGGQEVAKNIPVFEASKNGAIVLMMVPMCWEADIWLGGRSKYDEEHNPINIREYIQISTIAPGGSHTIWCENPETGITGPVNCLAYAMMKIAYLSHLIKEMINSRDEDELARTTGVYCPENGYAREKGAVCMTIYHSGKALMRVYICFSGATEDEDQQCANQVAHNLYSHLKQWDERFVCVLKTVEGVIP